MVVNKIMKEIRVSYNENLHTVTRERDHWYQQSNLIAKDFLEFKDVCKNDPEKLKQKNHEYKKLVKGQHTTIVAYQSLLRECVDDNKKLRGRIEALEILNNDLKDIYEK